MSSGYNKIVFKTFQELKESFPHLAELADGYGKDNPEEYWVFRFKDDYINYVIDTFVPELGTSDKFYLPNHPSIPNPIRWVHINDYFDELVSEFDDPYTVVDHDRGQVCVIV